MSTTRKAATTTAEKTIALMKERIAEGIKEFNNSDPDDESLELNVGDQQELYIEKVGMVIHILLYYQFSDKFVIEFFVRVGSDDAEIENIAAGIAEVIAKKYLCAIGEVQGIKGFI